MSADEVVVEARGAERARLLLLAGNDLPAAFYRPLLERLAAGGVRGAALAPAPFLGRPGPTTWADLVAATRARVEAHGTTLLAGHSLGGLLALLVAGGAPPPPAVRALALLEPAIAPWACLARRAARTYRREVVEADRTRFVNEPRGFRRLVRPGAFPADALALHLDVRRAGDPAALLPLLEALPSVYPLPRPSLPARVVRGACSGWAAGRASGWLARRLGAQLVTVSGAAHWLVHEGEEAVAAALADAAG